MKKPNIGEKEFWDVLINDLGWAEKNYGRVLNIIAGAYMRDADDCEDEGLHKAAKAYGRDFETIYTFLEEKGYYEN